MAHLSVRETLAVFSETDPKTGCLVWQRSVNPGGYGQIHRAGRTVRVHRLAWQLAHGTIPAGLYVDHKCRNRRCINLDHLQLVTWKQNGENIVARHGTASGVRGVYRCTTTGRWAVEVTHHGKKHWCGRFDDLRDAERAAIAKRNELFTNNIADKTRHGRHVATV